MPPPNTTGRSTRALRGASLLILLQVVSRAITFVANQVLLRFLTAQLLGVSTQLEVYYLSVIFFARESLRVAIQRQDSSSLTSKDKDGKDGENKAAQAVVNLGYLAIALGIPLALGFGWLYLNSLSAATLVLAPNLVVSLYIYSLAAVVELVSEPAFVIMQTRLQFGTRAAAESVATFLRCLVTLGSAVWGANRDLGVLPFALGQLSYGFGLLAVYAWNGAGLARREGFSLLPRRITMPPPLKKTKKEGPSTPPPQTFVLSYFYRPTLQLASSMMAQSVVKHILTQGDTFLVSILSTPTDQGVYALVNNYGGLLARLVFQPIEESSRSYFSRLLAPTTTAASESESATKQAPSPETPSSPDAPSPEAPSSPEATSAPSPAQEALTSLQSLLRFYHLLALVLPVLGPTAATPLLALVAGPRWAWTGAAECLAAYMWYIPLMAFNGVAEAFVASVASERELHRQSAWMAAFSAVFAGAGFVFLHLWGWGARGLVAANQINLICRIVWCWGFIQRYFAERGLEFDLFAGVVPSVWVGLAAAVTLELVIKVAPASAGQAWPESSRDAIVELAKVAAAGAPLLVVMVVSERKLIMSAIQAVRGRRP